MLSGLYALCSKLNELRNERGASAVEYGLLVALIAAAIAFIVLVLGETLVGIFESVVDAIS